MFALFAADLVFGGPVTKADPANSLWLRSHLHPLLTQVLMFVTLWHGTPGILAMSALLAVVLFATHRSSMIPWLLLTVQGGQLLNMAAKAVFQRARPQWDEPLLTLTTYSFPSGHAVASTVLWGFVYVVARDWPAPAAARRAVLGVSILMVALASFSRVYLGAHYTSDVLAGICQGLAWLFACMIVRQALTMRSRRLQETE